MRRKFPNRKKRNSIIFKKNNLHEKSNDLKKEEVGENAEATKIKHLSCIKNALNIEKLDSMAYYIYTAPHYAF